MRTQKTNEKAAPTRARRQLIPCLAACTAVLAAPAGAGDGFWTATGGGSWADAGSWDGGNVASGTDYTAYFGLSFEAVIPPNWTLTLDGARTVGNLCFTAQTGPDTWVLNAGAGGALTLSATFDLPRVEVTFPSQAVVINAVLGGAGGLEKQGAGTLVLGGANTYAGPTLLSGGALLVNGQIGPGPVTNAAGLLGGSGTVLGAVVIESGATFAPGSQAGALSLSNSLTLLPGSTTIMDMSFGHAAVQGLSSVTLGGTLSLANLQGPPSPGQSFNLFNAASVSGNFSSIVPSPGAGLRWQFDPASGRLSAVSSTSQPSIASIALHGANLVLTATNGAPGAAAYVLASPSLLAPLADWTCLASNSFDLHGQAIFSNTISPNSTQVFYLIATPAAP